MANLDSILFVLVAGCLSMASGIFFVLYCLEGPIYSPVLKKNPYDLDSDAQMRRVLLILQQFLTFGLPIVMVTLIISATVGSAFRVVLYGFVPLPVLVTLSITFAIIYSGLFVPSAIKIFNSANPEASADNIQAALAPIVRLHRNVGMIVAFTLILHLASVVFY